MTADQDMLFGLGGAASVVDDDVARREMRVYALNVQSPKPDRAIQLVRWLVDTQANVLVLTELSPGQGSSDVLRGMRAEGFTIVQPAVADDARYITALAVKGFAVEATGDSCDGRVVTADLRGPDWSRPWRIAGVYGQTNNLTAESSARRKAFQAACLDYLRRDLALQFCLAGDLNVPEPSRAGGDVFEPHDADFYRGLLDLGLVDAFRHFAPDADEHSWYGPRFGAQRIDHIMVSRSDCLVSSSYDHEPRTSRLSDHSAIRATIAPTEH